MKHRTQIHVPAVSVAISIAALVACGGESPSPRDASDESHASGSEEPSKINRAHENFKRGVNQTVDAASTAADKAQHNIQEAAHEGADELGVRRSVSRGRGYDSAEESEPPASSSTAPEAPAPAPAESQ